MQESRKHDIRVKADLFRRQCKVGRYGIIDLFKECGRSGYKLLRYPLGENADLGFIVKRDEDIVIFTNSCVRLSREIFTLAHEIGHAVLHLDGGSSFIDDKVTINNRNTDEREKEANYFAASLLMPADDIRRFIDLEIQGFEEKGLSAMDIAGVMSEFNVSFDMVLNRLADLGLINSNQRVSLANEAVEKKVSNLLRSVGGNARLNMPANEIDLPGEYIDYTIYNYNHKAVPKETLEKVLACYQLGTDDVSDKLIDLTGDKEADLDDLLGGLDD